MTTRCFWRRMPGKLRQWLPNPVSRKRLPRSRSSQGLRCVFCCSALILEPAAPVKVVLRRLMLRSGCSGGQSASMNAGFQGGKGPAEAAESQAVQPGLRKAAGQGCQEQQAVELRWPRGASALLLCSTFSQYQLRGAHIAHATYALQSTVYWKIDKTNKAACITRIAVAIHSMSCLSRCSDFSACCYS